VAGAPWGDPNKEYVMGSRTWIGIAAAAAASAALFAAPAQARTSIAVQIGTPGYVYTQPSYVYTQPSYVYTQPSYVYTEPSYYYPQPSYVYSQPYVVVAPGHRRHHFNRDSDRDGVPDRFDRRPYNPRRY
jgi:hypothetical protein